MNNDGENKILVTGASGQLGRRVVELLVESGASNVVATTRHPERLRDLGDRGVELRKADFDQGPAQLAAAFAGAKRMLLISTDAMDPGHRYEQQSRAIGAAVRAGVEHIAYTSLTHPVSDSPVLIAPDHAQTEQELEAIGVGYTALRNNLYADLLLISLPAAIGSGRLFAAAADGGAAYVTREDCARAAAAALASNFEGKRQLEITGPAVVTYAELAALASELSGKEVVYVPLDEEALIAGMVDNGLPEVVARLMASFDAGIRKGFFGPATDAVKDLSGTAPQSVRAFLEANKAALAQTP